MLKEIKLTNFKCFKEETSIPLSRFNLFTGVNGAGKSTALQALLLMRQSIEHNPYTTGLILNGNCVNLGSFDDVKNNEKSSSESIIFEFHINKKIILDDSIKSLTLNKKLNSLDDLDLWFHGSVSYQLKNNHDIGLSICNMIVNNANDKREEYKYSYSDDFIREEWLGGSVVSRLHKLELIQYDIDNNEIRGSIFSFDKIHFISADRIGPQEFHQKSNLPEIPHVGSRGEFAVNLLNKIGDELEVNESLYLKENPRVLGENPITLKAQTEAWLGKILNPLSLEATALGKSNFLELLIGGFKPSNVGFGYSSILPIIVTGLIAKPNEKIIIENPEIHLHPKAQSALIEFLIKVANTGVQIFIESHSDHIINGILVQCKKFEESQDVGISKDNVMINYFSQDEEDKNVKITKINIEDGGRIRYTPKGFFDQFTIDRKFLMGF